jgi:hypothetical protein
MYFIIQNSHYMIVAIVFVFVSVCIIGCMCWLCIGYCGENVYDEYEFEDEGEVKNPL